MQANEKEENIIKEIFFPALIIKEPKIEEYMMTGLGIIVLIILFIPFWILYLIGWSSKQIYGKLKEYYNGGNKQ